MTTIIILYSIIILHYKWMGLLIFQKDQGPEDILIVFIPIENLSPILRHHHCQQRAVKFRSLPSDQSLEHSKMEIVWIRKNQVSKLSVWTTPVLTQGEESTQHVLPTDMSVNLWWYKTMTTTSKCCMGNIINLQFNFHIHIYWIVNTCI
jgi:hypothetical protein